MKYTEQDAIRLTESLASCRNDVYNICRELVRCCEVMPVGWRDAKFFDFCGSLSKTIEGVNSGISVIANYDEQLRKKINRLKGAAK